ncbi:MAG: type pilus assembly protein PilC, partial [Actinomycetota bacterium]|nr:type pilus assembly protein PilC [Actinomycetota bacterium]
MSVTDQLLVAGDGEPVDVSSRRRRKSILQFEITKKRIPRKELMHFSRQLAVFIKAGIPILDALETIESETGNKFFKQILGDMLDSLRSGTTFAAAARQHAEAFPPYYLGILESAELTGRLDSALAQLSDYIERDVEARQKMSSALTYPAVIAFVAVVVVGVLVGFVLPRFKAIFAELNGELPLPTRMLLAVSDFFSAHWLLILIGLIAVIVGIYIGSRTPRGRVLRDRLVLRIPALGDLVRHVVLERFCRVLSSMMTAGVPLPEAMRVTNGAVSNAVFKKGLDDARDAMIRGEGLATPLAATGLFPASARQMFRVGEDTGTLDQQLETAATYFNRELDYKIKRFTSLFEPAIIIVMGLVVGFV